MTLLEVVFGVQTFIGGDQFRPEENSLILLNHRTRNDWNFMWSALFHATHPMSHNAKFVLKEDVKILPGPGKLFCCHFLKFHRIQKVARKSNEKLRALIIYPIVISALGHINFKIASI